MTVATEFNFPHGLRPTTRRSKNSGNIQGPYLLISSAMHLPRAQKVFKKAGVSTDLYPCDLVAKRTSNNFFEDYILPSSYALPQWDALVKEWVGTITYKLTGNG